jgi:hypothetical protein
LNNAVIAEGGVLPSTGAVINENHSQPVWLCILCYFNTTFYLFILLV